MFRNKPVAVIGSSAGLFGAVWAQAELRKVLAAMGARVAEVEVAVGRAAEKFDADGRLVDDEVRDQLRRRARGPRRAQPRRSRERRVRLVGGGGSSSASRRCTDERDSTPTSLPPSTTGTRS